MSETITPPDLLDDPALTEADMKSVWESVAAGKPVDKEVAARIWSRCERSREESFRRVGYVDVDDFLPSPVHEK